MVVTFITNKGQTSRSFLCFSGANYNTLNSDDPGREVQLQPSAILPRDRDHSALLQMRRKGRIDEDGSFLRGGPAGRTGLWR